MPHFQVTLQTPDGQVVEELDAQDAVTAVDRAEERARETRRPQMLLDTRLGKLDFEDEVAIELWLRENVKAVSVG